MFYNLQVTKSGENAPAVSAYSFESVEAAKANNFYFLSCCYGNSALDYFMAEIVDQDGACVCREAWHKPLEFELDETSNAQ